MPTLSQLGHILVACKVTTAEAWQRAAKRGGNDLLETLDALAAAPPWWAGDLDDPPPGLTDYQRSVIELWWEDEKAPLTRQLSLNQFLIVQKLGAGGQGEVYRARQLNPARFVAVKTLKQETEARRQRFEQEAKAMMRVVHPGVARFFLYERVRDALNKPTDEYLIAMEYVEGTDLYRLVQDNGPVPWKFAARWAVDLLGGLAVIHANGFIHRDVKPANIMILGPAPAPRVSPAETSAKLLDFGAAKMAADVKPTSTGSKRIFVGTREYAPPEQWNENVVPASDVYALGASLFHALTGRPPFVIESRDAIAFMRAHAQAPIPDVRDFNPDVPEAMSMLLIRMLAKAPHDRGTAAELAAEFREVLPAPLRDVGKPELTKTPRPAKPKPAPVAPVPEPEPEEKGPLHAIFHPILMILERIYLPAHLRPPAGHEPAVSERLTILLRRPLLLLTIVVLVGVLIFLIR